VALEEELSKLPIMISIKYQILISSSVVGLIILLIGFQTYRVLGEQCELTTQNETRLLSNFQNLVSIQKDVLIAHKLFSEPQGNADPLQVVKKVEANIQTLQFEENTTNKSELLAITNAYKKYAEEFGSAKNPTSLHAVRSITYKAEKTLRKALATNASWYQSQAEFRNDYHQKFRKWIMLGSVVVFLLAIICGQVIAKVLDDSLQGLKAAAKAYKSGDYSQRININARNEFGELSKMFNQLSNEAEQSKIIEHQNQELDDLNHQLKLKNDSLDSFVYRVSHDLKAPLINIKSLLKVVNGKLANHGDTAIMKTLGFMDKNTEKLQQTIYDLLEVSRIEMNLVKEKEMVKIQPLIDEVMQENVDDIKSSGTILNVDIIAADSILFSKPNLKSILANLITNGIKYRKQEGQNEINIWTQSIGNNTQLIYEDNGIGIDLVKHKDKLFGIFNRFRAVGVGTKFILSFPEAQSIRG